MKRRDIFGIILATLICLSLGWFFAYECFFEKQDTLSDMCCNVETHLNNAGGVVADVSVTECGNRKDILVEAWEARRGVTRIQVMAMLTGFLGETFDHRPHLSNSLTNVYLVDVTSDKTFKAHGDSFQRCIDLIETNDKEAMSNCVWDIWSMSSSYSCKNNTIAECN